MGDGDFKERYSQRIEEEPVAVLTGTAKAEREAANAVEQYDHMVDLIDAVCDRGEEFWLRPSLILDLQRIAVDRIESDAGAFRRAPVKIKHSGHVPPPWPEVPRLVDEMCKYVNDNRESRSPIHLAAYVLWRLNWIHPFGDGNGRTARATAYFVLCSRLGKKLPGTTTVPEYIANDKDPYYRALEAADAAWKRNELGLDELEEYLSELTAMQVLQAVNDSDPELPSSTLEKARGRRRLQKAASGGATPAAVGPTMVSPRVLLYSGLVAAGITVLLLVWLIARFANHPDQLNGPLTQLIVVLLAFCAATTFFLLGTRAGARGTVPIPGATQYPVRFGLVGAGAIFVIVYLLLVATTER